MAWVSLLLGHFPDERTTILIFGNHGNRQLHQDKVAEIYFRGRE